jgi:hypothetical protein
MLLKLLLLFSKSLISLFSFFLLSFYSLRVSVNCNTRQNDPSPFQFLSFGSSFYSFYTFFSSPIQPSSTTCCDPEFIFFTKFQKEHNFLLLKSSTRFDSIFWRKGNFPSFFITFCIVYCVKDIIDS